MSKQELRKEFRDDSERAGATENMLRRVMDGVRGVVKFNEPLQKYTSFRIGGPADVWVEPADVDDVCRVVKQAHGAKIPLFVVGGTNILVRDGGIRGVVMSLAKMRSIRQESDHVLYAEGGVGMPTLIGHAVRRGLSGLEWGAGIPGTVAGCVVMNAGTRLGEMKESVKAIRLVTGKGEVVDLNGIEIKNIDVADAEQGEVFQELVADGAGADDGDAAAADFCLGEPIDQRMPLIAFKVFHGHPPSASKSEELTVLRICSA